MLARSDSPDRTHGAVVDVEEHSVWMYMVREKKIVGDCWLFNCDVEHQPFAYYRARSAPPPAPARVILPGAVVRDPHSVVWEFRWLGPNSHVVVMADGAVAGCFAGDTRRGYSKHLREDCRWGRAWNAAVDALVNAR